MTDMEPEMVGKIILGVIGLIAAALTGRSWLIRRTSKDGVVVAGDTGQKDFMGVLREERDTLINRLDKLTTQRDESLQAHAKCMAQVGGLTVQVEHLQKTAHEQAGTILEQALKIEALERTVTAMRNHIDSLIGLRDANVNLDQKDQRK